VVGAGAKVLGPIRLGDDAQVGANAVVVGVPGEVRALPGGVVDPWDAVDPATYI